MMTTMTARSKWIQTMEQFVPTKPTVTRMAKRAGPTRCTLAPWLVPNDAAVADKLPVLWRLSDKTPMGRSCRHPVEAKRMIARVLPLRDGAFVGQDRPKRPTTRHRVNPKHENVPTDNDGVDANSCLPRPDRPIPKQQQYHPRKLPRTRLPQRIRWTLCPTRKHHWLHQVVRHHALAPGPTLPNSIRPKSLWW